MSNEIGTRQTGIEGTKAQGTDRTVHRSGTGKRHASALAAAMTVAVMACITSAASASASGPPYASTLDINADGIIDAYRLDRWYDGYPDVIATDLDQNGILEILSVDQNNDGYFDTIARDTQQNGVLDIVAFDTNLDGVLDRLIVDSNEDGLDDSTAVGYVGGSTIANPSIGIVGGHGPTELFPLVGTLAGVTGYALGAHYSDGDGWDDSVDAYPTDPYRH